jgi:hypothetical protein
MASPRAIQTIPNQMDSDIRTIQAGVKAEATTYEPCREREYPGQVWETIMLMLLSIALFAATIALPGLITIVVSNAVSAR